MIVPSSRPRGRSAPRHGDRHPTAGDGLLALRREPARDLTLAQEGSGDRAVLVWSAGPSWRLVVGGDGIEPPTLSV